MTTYLRAYIVSCLVLLAPIGGLCASRLSASPNPETIDWRGNTLNDEDIDKAMLSGNLYTIWLTQVPGNPEALKHELYKKVRNIAGALIGSQEKAILIRLKPGADLDSDLAVSEEEQSDYEILSIKDGLERFLAPKGLIDKEKEWMVEENKAKTLDVKKMDNELRKGNYLSLKLGGHFEARCGPVLDGVLGLHGSISNLSFDPQFGWALLRTRPGYSIDSKEIFGSVPFFMPFHIEWIQHLYGDYLKEENPALKKSSKEPVPEEMSSDEEW